MPEIRRNFLSGTLSAQLNAAAVLANSVNFANLPVIAAPDYMWITIGIRDASPEIVKVTAHAAASQQVTIVRARQSTLGGGADRQWASGTEWEHAPTVEDFGASEPYPKVLVEHQIAAANTAEAMYTAPAGKHTVITGIRAVNPTTTFRGFGVLLSPGGAAAANAHIILSAHPLSKMSGVTVGEGLCLSPGDVLRGQSTIDANMHFIVMGKEYLAPSPYKVLGQLETPAGTGAQTNIYTCPAGKHAVGTLFVCCFNLNRALVNCALSIDGAANANKQYLIASELMAYQETFRIGPIFMDAGDILRASSTVTQVVWNFHGEERDL